MVSITVTSGRKEKLFRGRSARGNHEDFIQEQKWHGGDFFEFRSTPGEDLFGDLDRRGRSSIVGHGIFGGT
jgi:hypothetical protein